MPETVAAADTPMLSAVEPELFVADIKAACAWFTTRLGFEVAFTYGEPPFYGQVKRDHAAINLRLVCEPVYVGTASATIRWRRRSAPCCRASGT